MPSLCPAGLMKSSLFWRRRCNLARGFDLGVGALLLAQPQPAAPCPLCGPSATALALAAHIPDECLAALIHMHESRAKGQSTMRLFHLWPAHDVERLPPLRTAASELSDNQRSMLMRLSFRGTGFSASKISGDCENDVSAS